MHTNEGLVDRIIRLMLAAGAVVAAINLDSTLAVVFGVVAAVMVVTAAIGFCPLYQLVGINTCRVPARR